MQKLQNALKYGGNESTGRTKASKLLRDFIKIINSRLLFDFAISGHNLTDRIAKVDPCTDIEVTNRYLDGAMDLAEEMSYDLETKELKEDQQNELNADRQRVAVTKMSSMVLQHGFSDVFASDSEDDEDWEADADAEWKVDDELVKQLLRLRREGRGQ